MATELWAKAFDEVPTLAEDETEHWLDRAARSAAFAGSGGGDDWARLDVGTRARLRGQALAWLNRELALWTDRLKHSEGVRLRDQARWTLGRWNTDSKLAGIREAARLEALPDAERGSWTALWSDVEVLRSRMMVRAESR